jgi:hypothetical protein
MVAVVPQPPLMIPQRSTGRAVATEAMRAAALSMVGRLAAKTDRWVVVGADPAGRRGLEHPPGGTFLGYGVDPRVALGPGPAEQVAADLPLLLLIAGRLRGEPAYSDVPYGVAYRVALLYR